MNQIRVTTYNVLCSKLVDNLNAPWTLKLPKNRLERIKNKLMGFIKTGDIICLQEVGRSWAEELKKFFMDREYDTTYAPYGKEFNDYMGVMIAVPYCYYIENTYIDKPSNHINVDNSLFIKVRKLFFNIDDENWIWAKGRKNDMIILPIRCYDKLIYVATYHAPCDYRYDETMSINIMSAIKCLEKYTHDIPCILAGDFNIQPDSKQYKIITAQYTPKISDPFGNWTKPKYVYKSAYDNKNSTHFCHRPYNSEKPFEACLDYIFYKDCVLDHTVDISETVDNMKNFMDLEVEPSDHIPLTAVFKM